jgi:hypothetical protein
MKTAFSRKILGATDNVGTEEYYIVGNFVIYCWASQNKVTMYVGWETQEENRELQWGTPCNEVACKI